jgi:hypothetical protein
MAPVGSSPPPVPHRRVVSYDDVVLQEAIRFARQPIEMSFGNVFGSPAKKGVLTITHRLAHLIVRAERDRQYWTMVGAKYFLNHLAKAVGPNPHPDKTLQMFRDCLWELLRHYEGTQGEIDTTELERIVILSGNSPDRILVGAVFENSSSFPPCNPLKIETTISKFVNMYLWDQT